MSDQPGTTTSRAARGDAPLRGELLSADRLAEEARVIAAEQRWIADERLHATPLIALMQRAASDLAADNRELAQAARAIGGSSPAGEWLLDNYYLIEEQVLLVREDLPADYGVELPRIAQWRVPRLPAPLHSAAHAHRSHRLAARRGVPPALHRGLPGDVAAHHRRGLGRADHAPHRPRREPAPPFARRVASMRAERAADSWAERLVLAAQDATTMPSPAPRQHRCRDRGHAASVLRRA